MPGLLDTFKQKATAVKDYLYPPAPNGMSLWDYAQQRANDPLQPNLSSRITQQDLINKGLNLAGLAPVGIVTKSANWPKDIAKSFYDETLGKAKVTYSVDPTKNLVDIASLRVPQKYRNKGEARNIMNELLNQADAVGYDARLLSSPLDKRTKDMRLFEFYKSLGFEPTGKTGNPLGDPWMLRKARHD
jgi:GNAT superfamily N-acetyltransferase